MKIFFPHLMPYLLYPWFDVVLGVAKAYPWGYINSLSILCKWGPEWNLHFCVGFVVKMFFNGFLIAEYWISKRVGQLCSGIIFFNFQFIVEFYWLKNLFNVIRIGCWLCKSKSSGIIAMQQEWQQLVTCHMSMKIILQIWKNWISGTSMAAFKQSIIWSLSSLVSWRLTWDTEFNLQVFNFFIAKRDSCWWETGKVQLLCQPKY